MEHKTITSMMTDSILLKKSAKNLFIQTFISSNVTMFYPGNVLFSSERHTDAADHFLIFFTESL